VLARGSAATNLQGERGWRIGIAHPLRPEHRLAEILLEDCALATSGSRVQSHRHGGKRYGHIIDPRSGWPADRVLSATVVARTAAEADALSTALFVMGAERASEFCRQRADIAAWLTVPSPVGHGVEIVAHGSQALDWRVMD
jgi:thiamine biosynthesis lipoprotein